MSLRRMVEPGLELRLLTPGDADVIFELTERNRPYLREWLPWVDRTHSVHDVREFIARITEQHESNLGPNLGIWLDGNFVGSVGAHPIDWNNRHCSIGYWIDAGCQGRGIMTRCCANLLDYLFDNSGLHRITIQCGTGNQKSCAIPDRLGFTREGIMREAEWVNDRWVDLVVWGMLDRDWFKSR